MNSLLYFILTVILSVSVSPSLPVKGRSASHFIVPRYSQPSIFTKISRPDIPRTIFLKNLLELDCLKQIYNQSNRKKLQNRHEYLKSQEQVAQKPLFKYKGDTFNNKMPGLFRRNRIKETNYLTGEEKFLLTPIRVGTFNYPTSLNFSQNWKQMPQPQVLFRPYLKGGLKEKKLNGTNNNTKYNAANNLQQEKQQSVSVEENNRNIMKISEENENQPILDNENDLKHFEVKQVLEAPPAVENSSNTKSFLHSLNVSKPTIIQPYEVEEIIEEDIRVDVENEKNDNLENLNFDEEEIYNGEIGLIEEDKGGTSSQKTILPNNGMKDLDSSINYILKGLIQPPPEKDKIQEAIGNNKGKDSLKMWAVSNDLDKGPITEKNKVTIIPPFLYTTLSKYFPKKGLIQPSPEKEKTHQEEIGNIKEKDSLKTWLVPNEPTTEKNKVTFIPPFLHSTLSKYFSKNSNNDEEKSNKVESLSNFNRNSENRSKSLILQDEQKKIAPNKSFASNNQGFWRLHPAESTRLKETPQTSSDFNDLENIKKLKILEEKKRKLLKLKQEEPKVQLKDLFKFYDDAKSVKSESLPSLPELFGYSIKPENDKGKAAQHFQFPNLQPNDLLYGQTFPVTSQNHSNLSETMPSTSKQLTNQKSIDGYFNSTTIIKVIDHDEQPIKEDYTQLKKSGIPEWDEINTQKQMYNKTGNETEALTELKQTAKEANTSKLSLNLESVTVKSEINFSDLGFKNGRKMHYDKDFDNTLDEVTESRRSDILISEALNDYEENQQENLPSNYLKVIKENISKKNFSIDLVVPIIPKIINDIRENNLRSEDISLISNATGKYWPAILSLSNNSNFDMLPLFKMKNEKDLEKLLENSLKHEDIEKTTLESMYDLTIDYSENYDFVNDFTDFYQDIPVEDLDFKRKKKFRPVREVDNYLHHLKAIKPYFYELENKGYVEKSKSSSIRIKRNGKDEDWRAEATREYFGSLEEELNENANDYLYDEIFYSDLAEDKELIQAELIEASNLQVSFQNVTSSLLKK